MLLEDRISVLKGIGKVTERRLNEAGIVTVRDALFHFPAEYRDMRAPVSAEDVYDGDFAFIKVSVDKVRWGYRRGVTKNLFNVYAHDGKIAVRMSYFNQGYMFDKFSAGQQVRIYGRAARQANTLLFTNPVFISEENEGEILPVYKLPKGVKQKTWRAAVSCALTQCIIPDELTKAVRERFSLDELSALFKGVHFPKNAMPHKPLREAALRDMMYFELSLGYLRARGAKPLAAPEGTLYDYTSLLKYTPTDSQINAMRQIAVDIGKDRAMNRLLHGDVGSGKTCVAFYAAYHAMRAGAQSALMAPTEILAEQHYENARSIFADKCALLTGSQKPAERAQVYAKVAAGEVSLVIGTHALLYSPLKFKSLSLIITDEQHRFGVSQRAELSLGEEVHTLIMSATPIPRTLSLIMYGETGVSTLDTLPAGRKPIKTSIVPSEKREAMYRWLKEQTINGEQAYVVCPLIDESDELNLKSAVEVYAYAKKMGINAALLHGRMKAEEKYAVMNDFRSGKTSVLVSTTVIEVGVDVKNANIMIIESAGRFGLAQLHQLRGRIGRCDKSAVCMLVNEGGSTERLKVLKDTSDGFKIAEEDLRQRGSGELLGHRQSGFTALPLDKELILLSREIIDHIRINEPQSYAMLLKNALKKSLVQAENIVLN